MNTHSIKAQLLALFRKSKKDRHRFLGNHLSANIAAQIFSLRTAEERNWTQTQLAKEAGIGQPRVPVYESPDYGAFSLTTLKKLAHAFDVAVVVKFVSFDDLANEIANQSSGKVALSMSTDDLIPQQARANAQDIKSIGPDFRIDPPMGVLMGECKSFHSQGGIYAAAGNFKQKPVALLPANAMDLDKQLV